MCINRAYQFYVERMLTNNCIVVEEANDISFNSDKEDDDVYNDRQQFLRKEKYDREQREFDRKVK